LLAFCIPENPELGQTLVTETVLAVLTTDFHVLVLKSLWEEKQVFTVTTSNDKRKRGKNPQGINKVNMKEGGSIKQERRK